MCENSKKKIFFWGGVGGGQSGCESRSEVFVKIKFFSFIYFFFLGGGGGGGSGQGGGRVGRGGSGWMGTEN